MNQTTENISKDNTILLKPKIDVVFHALFREENNKLTEALISDILGEKVKITEYLDRHLDINSADEKLGIMDLKVILEDGSICNIEIQLKRQKYQNDRFLYYWADAYSSQLKKGDEYSKLNRTISIIILDHEIAELNNFNELDVKWQIRDNKTHTNLLTDKFEIVIIEIPKAKRLYIQNSYDKISQWMLFFDNPNSKEVSHIMNENNYIKKATEELKQVSGDYEIRRIAELREKAIRDEAAALEYANEEGLRQGIEQGVKQGIKQGIVQEKVSIAKNLLNLNVDIDTIIQATGLSKEQILKLK